MPRSIVDQTISAYKERNRCATSAPNMQVMRVMPSQGPIKKNTPATQETWSSITSNGNLIIRGLREIDPETGYEPYTMTPTPLFNRDEHMVRIQSVLGDQFLTGGPTVPDKAFRLIRVSDTLYRSGNLLFCAEPANVITIKMWGFAGTSFMEDMVEKYRDAVKVLLYGTMNPDGTVVNRGLMSLALEKYQTSSVNPEFVLHFDGDAGYEKDKDANKPNNKFSHNIFAPIVAKFLKEEVKKTYGQNIAVHLCITKVEKDDDNKTILQKFGDVGTDGMFEINTNIDRAKSEEPKHAYPFYDKRYFDSITINVQNIKYTNSEVECQKMIEALYKNRIVLRSCLAIGGNTKDSALAISEEDESVMPRWDVAVRSFVMAKNPAKYV